jgi:hypothetical protein
MGGIPTFFESTISPEKFRSYPASKEEQDRDTGAVIEGEDTDLETETVAFLPVRPLEMSL